MDQDTVPRDATSTVLRLLRRLCAAAPAPGGAWREAFVAFLWRLWSRLQACKNRNGAAPVPVADTRTLDGDDDAEVTEDDDYYLGKKEGALHIERTKNSDANLAGPSALGKDNVGNNAHLAGPGALGVDFKCKNAYLDGQVELGKDDFIKEYELGIGPVTPAAATKDYAGYFSKVTEEDGDEGYFSCKSKVTEEDDDDARSKNDRALGIQSNDVDSKTKNAQDTDLAGAADLAKDDMGKNNAELDGPAVIGIKSTDKKGLGVCSKIEVPVQKAPALAPWGSARAGRAPARAVEEEDDERRATHLKYVNLCASLKGKRTYCFSCFMDNQLDPATRGKKPAEIEKNQIEAKKHMDSSHKSKSDPRKCKKQGCFAM